MRKTILTILLLQGYMLIACHKQFDPTLNNNNNSDGTSLVKTNADTLGRIIVGAPTDISVRVSLLFTNQTSGRIEYSTDTISFDSSSPEKEFIANSPEEVLIDNLTQGTRYYYRLRYKEASKSDYQTSPVYSFITARKPGSTFSFGVQGDSHPERVGKMFSDELYRINMKNVSSCKVDLYFALGDDFSIESLIQNGTATSKSVDNVYESQRKYLGIPGSNGAIFLVNGNHEQAAKYLLDGTASSPAVLAANSRKKYYPLPLPDQFYSGDMNQVDHAGYLGDYYSFTWGDALFVVIDPYWHSSVAVDNTAGKKGKGARNLWDNTLGDEQYNWFKATLENSTAKYKFVFTHHVLGTGRGGIEEASLCEWGGYSQNGVYEFDKYRPGWGDPIHQLMVRNKVTIFFQGHDHLYCRQELDGVIYQEVPNPADNTYTAFNSNAYTSGKILPNSGFLNVTVSPGTVRVDYIGATLPADEASSGKNGEIKYSYSLSAK